LVTIADIGRCKELYQSAKYLDTSGLTTALAILPGNRFEKASDYEKTKRRNREYRMFSIKPGRGAVRERVLVKRAVRANSREAPQTARNGTKAAWDRNRFYAFLVVKERPVLAAWCELIF